MAKHTTSEAGPVRISQLERCGFVLRVTSPQPLGRMKRPTSAELASSFYAGEKAGHADQMRAWRKLIEAADVLGVDPRWLLTGEPSPAGQAALQQLGRWRGREALRTDQFDELARLLSATPQPPLKGDLAAMGQCRYCGCLPDAACPEGCGWVDRELTICSACLIPK